MGHAKCENISTLADNMNTLHANGEIGKQTPTKTGLSNPTRANKIIETSRFKDPYPWAYNMEQLTDFLKKNNEKSLIEDTSSTFYVVMGNEASDMDSIVSSILYAFYLSLINSNPNAIFLPIMNIPRADFSLRTETSFIFHELGISVDYLIFLEPHVDSRLLTLQKNARLRIILVDHNRLANHQDKYAQYEILDHHKDEKMYQPHKKEIQLVGSCITLVTQKILNDERHKQKILTAEVAKLVLGLILLDTVNLDPKAEKVTQADLVIANQLREEILHYTLPQQTDLFNRLQAERENTGSLSTTDLLRADYKQWKMGNMEVGMPAARRSQEEWLQKDPDFGEILYVMTVFNDANGHMRRELVVITERKDLYAVTEEFLLNKTNLQLSLVKEEESKKHSTGKRIVKFFSQGNIGASRKQMQPFVQTLYSTLQL